MTFITEKFSRYGAQVFSKTAFAPGTVCAMVNSGNDNNKVAAAAVVVGGLG
jgi:hypothetical protein